MITAAPVFGWPRYASLEPTLPPGWTLVEGRSKLSPGDWYVHPGGKYAVKRSADQLYWLVLRLDRTTPGRGRRPRKEWWTVVYQVPPCYFGSTAVDYADLLASGYATEADLWAARKKHADL